MAYIVLARKYRPQTFEDIVGQEHIARVLKNAIKEKRIAHGYIFSGQRGVGKTSTARIFAKALNCKDNSSEEPCNKCVSCLEITKDNSLDVLEIDGASNRGIDEIRSLREDVKYAPSSSKYKIYVIDEVHMLTTEAFNALLKTLEEPPAHAIFIFATTSTQKIPPTILSRCQRFNFRPLSIKEISEQLLKVAGKENIKIDDKAIAIISRSAGGALRDALSIFDQVISFCGSDITAQDVISILGIVKEDILSEMIADISANDTKKLLQTVGETVLNGYDPLNIVTDLQEYIRNIMLYKISPDLVSTVSDKEKLKLYSQNFSVDILLRFIDMLSECVYGMKNAEQPILILESYCVKLTQKYVGLDEIVSRLEAMESSSYNTPEPGDREITISDKKTIPQKNVVASSASSQVSLEKVKSVWNELSKDSSIKPRVSAAISGSDISQESNGVFTLESDNSFNLETIESNRNIWLPFVEKKLGGKFNFETKVKSKKDTELEEVESNEDTAEIIETEPENNHSAPQPSKPAVTKKGTSKEIYEKEPIAKTIVDLFGGEIVEE
ncbi:MAG: DNA polymerase III subunit gamma/tau [Elusimicrobia bacterium]|nr:DNA polymerase III subunit gamma/tau [Elusimicrobiota bacterium]